MRNKPPPPEHDVTVFATGVANTASIMAAFERLGARPRLTAAAVEIRRAPFLVLPGVGSFGAAMERLERRGVIEALRARIADNRPTLAICVGMQLLAESSEESPGMRGLAVCPGRFERFQPGVRVPQLGWNRVSAEGRGYVLPGDAYFANSYRLAAAPDGFRAATAHHGAPFVAALERGRLLACQFHPELSGAWGAALLKRWLQDETVWATTPPRHGGSRGLLARIIPCLDILDGRVVKGVRFQGLTEAGEPVERAALYEAQGADELVLLDVSATPEGRGTGLETVRRVRRALSIPLSVGGGVRTVEDAARLLEAGADKVGVNTAAFENPTLLTELSERFGRQCTVLALDAAAKTGGGWEVIIRSGREKTGRDALEWAREATAAGAGEILLTSWDRDGTRLGYDLEFTTAVARAVDVPIIASGGVDSPEHLAEGLAAGADAVLAASIFHYGEHTPDGVKRLLAARGLEVRQ